MGVWGVSSSIFALLYAEHLAMLCSGLASPACLRVTLALRPKLNQRLSDFNGTTPLIYLLDRSGKHAPEREASSLMLLLNAGAEPNQSDEEGWLPLMVAAANGQLNLVKLLVENGAEVNARAHARSMLDGMTPLMAASHHGHGAIVQYLLERGARPAIRSSNGLDAATIAALEGHETVLALLREKGLEPDAELLEGMGAVEELIPSTDLKREPASHRRVIRARRPEE